MQQANILVLSRKEGIVGLLSSIIAPMVREICIIFIFAFIAFVSVF